MTNPNTQEARETDGLFSYTKLKAIFNGAIDLIFPPSCQHCGRVDTYFCTTCQDSIENRPIELVVSDEIHPLKSIVSTGVHEGLLQASVQALKYNGQRQLGAILAKRVYQALQSANWEYDCIIPVPLHENRLAERGYNQAEAISQHLAELCDAPHLTNTIIRQIQKQSQVNLNRIERIENVKDNFQAISKSLDGLTVLLVDDVKTSGATTAACAEVALDSGAKDVYGITVTAARFQ